MKVLRTMNSLSTSFWMVPANASAGTPCSPAELMNRASTGKTAPFIVIETLIWSSGISRNRVFISAIESIATPAMPTSSATRSLSESYPRWVGRSKAYRQPHLSSGKIAPVEGVGLLSRRKTGILPNLSEVASHTWLDRVHAETVPRPAWCALPERSHLHLATRSREWQSVQR